MNYKQMEEEKDRRPPLKAWAPGEYWGNCSSCGKDFLGNKRAVMCASCAYEDRIKCTKCGTLQTEKFVSARDDGANVDFPVIECINCNFRMQMTYSKIKRHNLTIKKVQQDLI